MWVDIGLNNIEIRGGQMWVDTRVLRKGLINVLVK